MITFKNFLAEARNVTFYKALPEADLKRDLIPGTVTISYDEAYSWWERYNSQKKNPKGPARHIQRAPAVIIKFTYDADQLLSAAEFQRAGVREHDRTSCWTSSHKDKAQINEPISSYEIVLQAPK